MDYKITHKGTLNYTEIEMDEVSFNSLIRRIEIYKDYHIIRTIHGNDPIVLINDIDEFPCYHAIATRVEYGDHVVWYIEASPAFLEYITPPPPSEEIDIQGALDILFGNGSGEELHDYATQHGLSTREADMLISLLYAIDVGNEF